MILPCTDTGFPSEQWETNLTGPVEGKGVLSHSMVKRIRHLVQMC
jgi:hypothetical protein